MFYSIVYAFIELKLFIDLSDKRRVKFILNLRANVPMDEGVISEGSVVTPGGQDGPGQEEFLLHLPPLPPPAVESLQPSCSQQPATGPCEN